MPSGTLVLLYHRVCELDRDPYGFAVRPERFAEQCEVLRRRYDVVPLLESNCSQRHIVITFDDGYVDNCGDACRILSAAGLPATFFITAGRIGERTEVWWDRLEQIVLGFEPEVGYIDVEIEGRRLWADVRSPAARERAHLALYWRLRRLRPSRIEPILEEIAAQLGVQPAHRETHRWMTGEELRSLSASPGVDVGAHTITHPVLAALPEDEQWKEIDGSRQQLAEFLNTPVRVFSYPYGSYDAFDRSTTELVEKSGFTMACTGTGGLAGPQHCPFSIPRNVVGDWDASAFEQWLGRWLDRS
jgi:peptidoglycan/xylan/chitin deacetylase (PgdA/CDA1 family)